MKSIKPWPRGFAWFAFIVASLSLLLALFNLVVNTERISTWLPLLVIMPLPLYFAIVSLRSPRGSATPDR